MHALASSAVTPEGWLNTGTALVVAIVSGAVAIGIAFMQGRSNKKARHDAAVVWQEQAEELRDRMARQYENQLTAQREQYESSIKWYQDELAHRRKDRDDH